jgi:hypothetical protein
MIGFGFSAYDGAFEKSRTRRPSPIPWKKNNPTIATIWVTLPILAMPATAPRMAAPDTSNRTNKVFARADIRCSFWIPIGGSVIGDEAHDGEMVMEVQVAGSAATRSSR